MREICEISEGRVDELLVLYRQTWWAAERRRDEVVAMLAGSDLVVGCVDAANELVAFARVLSDGVYFAMIFDVIVAAERRGTGLGEALMRMVLARPELAEVRSIELVCQPDLVGFYERFGFSTRIGTSRLMRKTSDPLLTESRPR